MEKQAETDEIKTPTGYVPRVGGTLRWKAFCWGEDEGVEVGPDTHILPTEDFAITHVCGRLIVAKARINSKRVDSCRTRDGYLRLDWGCSSVAPDVPKGGEGKDGVFLWFPELTDRVPDLAYIMGYKLLAADIDRYDVTVLIEMTEDED
jgi:hypothetical protein